MFRSSLSNSESANSIFKPWGYRFKVYQRNNHKSVSNDSELFIHENLTGEPFKLVESFIVCPISGWSHWPSLGCSCSACFGLDLGCGGTRDHGHRCSNENRWNRACRRSCTSTPHRCTPCNRSLGDSGPHKPSLVFQTFSFRWSGIKSHLMLRTLRKQMRRVILPNQVAGWSKTNWMRKICLNVLNL